MTAELKAASNFSKNDWEVKMFKAPVSNIFSKSEMSSKSGMLRVFAEKIGAGFTQAQTASCYVSLVLEHDGKSSHFQVRLSDHMVGLKKGNGTLSLSTKETQKSIAYKLSYVFYLLKK